MQHEKSEFKALSIGKSNGKSNQATNMHEQSVHASEESEFKAQSIGMASAKPVGKHKQITKMHDTEESEFNGSLTRSPTCMST